jgi:hypothetical protein
MTPEEIKSRYIFYAKKNLKESLDEIVPSSSNSFKKHLNKLVVEYIEKHMNRFVETSTEISDLKYQDVSDDFFSLDITGLNNILSNSIKMAERISDGYIQHKQLFKQAYHKEGKDGFRPLETKNTEELIDGIDLIIYRNKVKKYAHSFLRSYKNLLNEDSFRLFSRIYDGDYDRSFVQKRIRKIASFKDSDDLTNALTKIIESEHSVDYIKHKIEENNLNADIIYSDEEKIILDIKDFKASQILGSSQWCISNQESFFEDYINGSSLALYAPENEDDLWNSERGNQIFCFNFNLDASDPEFATGLTISNSGTLYAAHDNDDNSIIEDIFDDGHDVDPVIFTYIKNIKTHDPDTIINNLDDPTIVYEDNYLSLNYRNPLNILIKLEDKFNHEIGGYSFAKRSQKVDFDFTIIRKSLHDLHQYKDISNSEMLNDLIKSYPILKEINSIKVEKHNELFFDEFKDEHCVNEHKFWECFETNRFIKNLNSVEIDINYRKNKEIINDVFNDFDLKSIESSTNRKGGAIGEAGFFVKKIDNEFVKKMFPFVIENDEISKETKVELSFSCAMDEEIKTNSKKLEFALIDKGVSPKIASRIATKKKELKVFDSNYSNYKRELDKYKNLTGESYQNMKKSLRSQYFKEGPDLTRAKLKDLGD